MASQSNGSGAERVNTLGLNSNELNQLRNKLDQGKNKAASKRVFARWQFTENSAPVRIIHPAGNEVVVRMACRNLSNGGIGLLHRSYLHLGTRCIVTLHHPSDGDFEIPGEVVRCIHVKGMIHEIGIKFDEEIEVREFMKPNPLQEISAIESIDPSTLIGTILLVEDSEMDTRLVKHFLRDTQLRVKHAKTIAEAEKAARSGVGLILCDIHLGNENGGDLVKKLHESGSATPPIVMTSADTSETTNRLVLHPGVKGFLAKPFSQENLIRAVAEFFREPVEEENEGSQSGATIDRQIYDALMPELAKAADKLGEAAASGDSAAVLSLLMQLKGVAPLLGLSDLAMLLETLASQLSMSPDIEAVRELIAEVVENCKKTAAGA